MRSKDRINSQGIGRSMGYGFVEFTTHEAALSVVRAVSNNPSVFGPNRVAKYLCNCYSYLVSYVTIADADCRICLGKCSCN